jgi:hypothetical protein
VHKRIAEAFVGEYASGKSENAIYRALSLKKAGGKVTLVDFDIVEPCYTLRPLKQELTELGLNVLAWSTSETFGLGEAGQTILPQARWALRREGHIIVDVGYGADGARALNLLEGSAVDPDLRVVLVLNARRPMTDSAMRIEEYIESMGRVDGIIANTHLADETTPQTVEDGYHIIKEVAKRRNIPIDAISVSQQFNEKYPKFGLDDKELRVLGAFMPRSFW